MAMISQNMGWRTPSRKAARATAPAVRPNEQQDGENEGKYRKNELDLQDVAHNPTHLDEQDSVEKIVGRKSNGDAGNENARDGVSPVKRLGAPPPENRADREGRTREWRSPAKPGTRGCRPRPRVGEESLRNYSITDGKIAESADRLILFHALADITSHAASRSFPGKDALPVLHPGRPAPRLPGADYERSPRRQTPAANDCAVIRKPTP